MPVIRLLLPLHPSPFRGLDSSSAASVSEYTIAAIKLAQAESQKGMQQTVVRMQVRPPSSSLLATTPRIPLLLSPTPLTSDFNAAWCFRKN